MVETDVPSLACLPACNDDDDEAAVHIQTHAHTHTYITRAQNAAAVLSRASTSGAVAAGFERTT